MPELHRRFTTMLAIRTTETWTTQSAIGALFLLAVVVIVGVAVLRRYLRK